MRGVYCGSILITDSCCRSWVTRNWCFPLLSGWIVPCTLTETRWITPFYGSPVWLCESGALCGVTQTMVCFQGPSFPRLTSLPPTAIVLQRSIIKRSREKEKEKRKEDGRKDRKRAGWDWRLIDWGWLSKRGLERQGGGVERTGGKVTSRGRAD